MQSKQPLVSIIMNCYNGEKYLRDAIDSVLTQTYQNWELVFWDNQSTDYSAEIFKSYSDPRLRYFYAPKHTLLYEARNYAIGKSSGEFVAFLDVDDWWIPEKLEKQIPLFSDPKVGFVCAHFWVYSMRKKKQWEWLKTPAPVGWVLDDLLEYYFVGLLTLVIRRSALTSLEHPFDSRYHIIGDFDLSVRLSMRWELGCVHEPVAFYRLHDGNESSKHRIRNATELEYWLKEMNQVEAIRTSPHFYCVKNNQTYLKAIGLLLQGDKKSAVTLFTRMVWGKRKLRLLFALVLPTAIIQKVKT